MTPEERDKLRRETGIIGKTIRQLERRYELADEKRRKAEAEAAEAERELAEVQAAKARTHLPLPEGDICIPCWLNHGHICELQAIPADDPELYDRMKCGRCGRIEDRENWRGPDS